MSGSQSEVPGIVARWRIREDEVQVNQAVAAVCQDPPVAAAFVRAVLEIASQDPEFGQQAAKVLQRLPAALRCGEQSHLPEQRRRVVLRERRHAGIADLDFTDDASTFRLIVELKINAAARSIGGGQTQVESYVRIAPVVAIARKPLSPPEKNLDNWLGTVRWAHLAGRLAELPIVAETLRNEWLELFNVMQDDGDFEEEAPKTSRSSQQARAWLETNKATLRSALAEATAASRRNGGRKQDRTKFASTITTSKVSAGRDLVTMAFYPPKGSKGAMAGPVWIEIVPAYAPSPKATVSWWPGPKPRWWKRADRDADAAAHSQLESNRFVVHPTNYSYRFTTDTPADRVREAGLDALVPEIGDALAAVGKSGVLKACLDSWLR